MTGGELNAKCATCASAVGIASCTVSMTLSAVGIATIGLAQNSGMGGMSGGSSGVVAGGSSALLPSLIVFLSGFWGEVILLASFVLMAYGMWSIKKIAVMFVALLGAVVLFVGMYAYFSIGLETMGSVVLILAYASACSRKAAAITRLA
ncbi:MAG: hypothetical protein JRN20_23010 [Nitrososphaerota archaeon]|nr:hypothetical protein [Nitrososphaerota archaeon]